MNDPTMMNTMMIGAVTSLAAVVTFLWKQISDNHKETRAARDECEKDREKLWRALSSISPEIKES